ncbi:MAG: pitrilysin family protein [Myxococcota bacterium]
MRTLFFVVTLAAVSCSQSAPKNVAATARADDPNAFRSKPPAPGPSPVLRAPIPSATTLKNGLTLLMVPDGRLPIVSTRMLFKAGSAADPKGLEGLASFMAGLLESGTKTRSATQIASEAELLGSSIDVGLDGEVIELSTSALTENFEELFAILVDCVRNSVFSKDEIERARKQRLIAIQQERDSPSRIARRTFYENVYAGHPYGHVAIGTQAGIERLTRKDLLAFYRRYVVPERAALVVTGDIDPAKMKNTVEKFLGDWPQGPTLSAEVEARAPGEARVILVNRPGAPQSHLLLGHPSIPRSHPDYYSLLIANQIFGGQFSSRINLNLREDKGYTYGASSSVDFRIGNGPFIIRSAVRTDVTAASITEILTELAQLRNDGVTEEELRLAKNNFSLSLPGYFQTQSAIARIVGNLFVYDLPLDYYQQLPERIGKVTAEDVKRVANAHLIPEKLNLIVVGDQENVLEPLKGLNRGEVQVISDEGA